MELLIVRHAIACERDVRRWPDDAARPLSPRGAMRARRAAAGIKQLGVRPARVLVSPLARTQQTAAILTHYGGWPKATVCPHLVPGGSPHELFRLLARTRGRQLAVIGHQPDLGRFMAICLPGSPAGDAFALRKMSLALIAFRGTPTAGRGELHWLVPPKLLRAIR